MITILTYHILLGKKRNNQENNDVLEAKKPKNEEVD